MWKSFIFIFVNLNVIIFAKDPMISPVPPIFTPNAIVFQLLKKLDKIIVAGTLLMIWLIMTEQIKLFFLIITEFIRLFSTKR